MKSRFPLLKYLDLAVMHDEITINTLTDYFILSTPCLYQNYDLDWKRQSPFPSASPSLSVSTSPTPSSTPSAMVLETPESNVAVKMSPNVADGDVQEGEEQLVAKGGMCFPMSAQVRLVSGEMKEMGDVKTGDEVHVGNGRYAQVFAWTHRKREGKWRFIRIVTATITPPTTITTTTVTTTNTTANTANITVASARTGATIAHAEKKQQRPHLLLTPSHYVYTYTQTAQNQNNNPKEEGRRIMTVTMASNVRVGDTLIAGNGAKVRVVLVDMVYDIGLFNPQTTHGDLVVNDIRVTTFTAAVKHPMVGHALLAAVRAAYKVWRLHCGFECEDISLNVLPWID